MYVESSMCGNGTDEQIKINDKQLPLTESKEKQNLISVKVNNHFTNMHCLEKGLALQNIPKCIIMFINCLFVVVTCVGSVNLQNKVYCTPLY